MRLYISELVSRKIVNTFLSVFYHFMVFLKKLGTFGGHIRHWVNCYISDLLPFSIYIAASVAGMWYHPFDHFRITGLMQKKQRESWMVKWEKAEHWKFALLLTVQQWKWRIWLHGWAMSSLRRLSQCLGRWVQLQLRAFCS